LWKGTTRTSRMRYGHPQQTQIIGRVPIGVGPMTARFADEDLASACTKGAAAPNG
jgi:hypothetical protein